MFLHVLVENVEQVDFLNTWLGGPKNQKAKATSNFPYLCPDCQRTNKCLEYESGKYELREPVNVKFSSSVITNNTQGTKYKKSQLIPQTPVYTNSLNFSTVPLPEE